MFNERRHGCQKPLGVPLESAKETQIAQEVPADMLCLSRRRLNHIEDSILNISTIKHLYLEGNEISILPGTLFSSLPNMVWLDLRNNQIGQLPAEVGQHRCLKTMLLEGNPITKLPLELGNVITLRALSLRRCPIVFPPQDIITKGVQCILQFLRRSLAERPVSRKNTLPEMPPIERLQLSSLDCPEEGVDTDELQRFEELKLRMMQMERVEFEQEVSSPSCPPNCRVVQGRRNTCDYILSNVKRKKEQAKGMFPHLSPCDVQYRKGSEERKVTAMREQKENQALFEQQRKDYELLREWRSKAQIKQERGAPWSGRWSGEKERLRRAPYATDIPLNMEDNDEYTMHNKPQLEQRQSPVRSVNALEEIRMARERDLEQRIRTHVHMMQERCRRTRDQGGNQMKALHQDTEKVNMLQQGIVTEGKWEHKQDYRFTAFTGEDSPRSYLS
ncbi:hypothetical protein AGOR_G00117260 [Albula goreensis]|uniref:Leucine-rich repeat-containing protein 27 n=1 Tax=Albula goreensis TaxID=1534307 RepID=A0A8T3DEE9_9TELE|nr:hypothetical protein AGOR_G00117260 [Albula goreensis]